MDRGSIRPEAMSNKKGAMAMRKTIALRERQRQDETKAGVSIRLRQATLIAEQLEAAGLHNGWAERTVQAERELYIPGIGWEARPTDEIEDHFRWVSDAVRTAINEREKMSPEITSIYTPETGWIDNDATTLSR